MTTVNQFPKSVERVTIKEAATDLCTAMAIQEQMSETDKREAIAKFLWLLGYTKKHTDVALMRAAEVDARQDPSLVMWLHLSSPAEFLEHFEADDHSSYELYEVTGTDFWAYQVIERVRRLIASERGNFQWGFEARSKRLL